MTSIDPGRYVSTGLRLQGRTAIVTGGSSGIGRAICFAYANEGAKVLVTDLRPTSRNPTEADVATHEKILQHGGEADFLMTDVTDEKSIGAAVQEAVARWGRLDIMVNCAGVATDRETDVPRPIWESKTSTWNFVMKINGDGVFNGTRAASAQMVKQDPLPPGDRGWIINLSSIFGLVSIPASAPYVASKHLVMGLTKAAALDLAPFTVHCNAICPGYVSSAFTDPFISDPGVNAAIQAMHPLRGIGIPEHVSRIAVFLASDDARWVTGTGLVVDGGYTAQ